MGFQAAVRAAAITTLDAYATAQSVKLQTYPGRPRSIHPPTAFVDRLSESITYRGPTSMARTVSAEVVLIHGSFDSGDAVAQKDAFVDGYILALSTNPHAAGANTTLGVVATEDDPTFVPDWVLPEERRTYFATRMTLEGFAGE